jgi:hypothetical protein
MIAVILEGSKAVRHPQYWGPGLAVNGGWQREPGACLWRRLKREPGPKKPMHARATRPTRGVRPSHGLAEPSRPEGFSPGYSRCKSPQHNAYPRSSATKGRDCGRRVPLFVSGCYHLPLRPSESLPATRASTRLFCISNWGPVCHVSKEPIAQRSSQTCQHRSSQPEASKQPGMSYYY